MAVVRFKSRETGDLVMLGPVAKRVLGIVGKDAEASGILLPDQIPAVARRAASSRAVSKPRSNVSSFCRSVDRRPMRLIWSASVSPMLGTEKLGALGSPETTNGA